MYIYIYYYYYYCFKFYIELLYFIDRMFDHKQFGRSMLEYELSIYKPLDFSDSSFILVNIAYSLFPLLMITVIPLYHSLDHL